MWVTKLKCEENKVDESVIENIASDIERKDDSFRYEVENGNIVVFSKSQDQAYQRGAWFRRKIDFRITYDVYEQIG